jgi:cyclic pyranopterin phosphate synthase
VAVPEIAVPATGELHRPPRPAAADLRISVTDRCNFRCSYCMPQGRVRQGLPYLPHTSLLSFEEMTRLARLFAAHGVRKIRLTGGEPLLRKNLEGLVEQLAESARPAASRWTSRSPPTARCCTQGRSAQGRRPAARDREPGQRWTTPPSAT